MLVSVELGISVLQLIAGLVKLAAQFFNFVFKARLLFFEALLHIHHFFFLPGQLSGHLGDLVAQLLFKLDDALLTSLQVKCLLSHLGVKGLQVLERLIKGLLTVAFLDLPCIGYFLDLLDLSLFQVSLELSLLGTLPHLQLPHGLVVFLVGAVRCAGVRSRLGLTSS